MEANIIAQKNMFPGFFTMENDVIKLKTKEGNILTSFWNNQRRSNIDFVLPGAQAELQNTVPIPHAYQVLMAALQYFAFTSDEKKINNEDIIIPLSVVVIFEDIGGVQISKEFTASVGAWGAQKVDGEEHWKFSGRLKFQSQQHRISDRVLELSIVIAKQIARLPF